MIKYQCIKNDVVTNEWTSDFADENYYEPGFGLPERPELNELGEPTGITLPAEYTIEIVDISAEIAAQNSKLESIEALNLGMDIMADIRVLNKAKIAAQTLDFAALLADQTVANIERALFNGSLDTAKTLINGLQSFYSAEEKAPIVAKIDAHLAKWSE